MPTNGVVDNKINSNRTIARNALMLYVRMFVTVIVGLYTSRVVLATLGEEDYGIYGVVGGIVAMMGFLNASMSGATSRFLTYELGRGDKDRLARTFSSAMIVHVGIALVVLVLAETVGLWFLCNKLVIPAERMTAAHWVYQLSIASAMLSITQVPYNSVIIAHEKMDVYAYVEILNSVLKLAIVFLLLIGKQDKLILYAVLHFAVSVLILGIYRIYCIRRFEESHMKWNWDKEILKPLLSFSGWNLYGNFGNLAQLNGNNIVINMFYGAIMNASVGVAYTVSNIVNAFSANIMLAFRPQIIKTYSIGSTFEMVRKSILAFKSICFIYTLMSIPLFVEADYILSLWLEDVPSYATIFLRLILIAILFETIRYILNIGIHATGNVELLSIITGSILMIVPIGGYCLLKVGFGVITPFILLIFANLLLCIVNLCLYKYFVNVGIFQHIMTFCKVIMIYFVVLVIGIWHKSYIPPSIYRLFFMVVEIALLLIGCYWLICLDTNEKAQTCKYLKEKFYVFISKFSNHNE